MALCSFGALTRTASTSRALSALQRHEVFHDLRGVGKRHLIESPVLQVGVDVPYVQAERPAYLRGRHALSQLLFPTPLPLKALGSSPAFRLGICRKKRVDELRIFARKILPRLAQSTDSKAADTHRYSSLSLPDQRRPQTKSVFFSACAYSSIGSFRRGFSPCAGHRRRAERRAPVRCAEVSRPGNQAVRLRNVQRQASAWMPRRPCRARHCRCVHRRGYI